MKRTFGVVALAVVLGTSARAHHSFAAYYFEDQTVSLEGEVVEFQYVAPHAWVIVTAPDATGRPQRYSAEWANPTRLARDSITRDSIRPGDRVIISGSPGRNGSEYKVHLKRIERPADGWSWRGGRRR